MVVRLHEGDSIEGFETENPERKPANSGEAGGAPFTPHTLDFLASADG